MTNPIVPQYPEAGPAQSVVVVNDSEVVGGPAIPVYGWTGLPTDGRSVEGAPAMRVKVISAADLTMNGGKFWLEGRPFAMPVSGDATAPAVGEGNVAVAVYPVNAWPSVTPPPTPVLPQVASATLLLDLRASQLALSDGAPVSTWPDKSGAGRDFTQSGTARPTYNVVGGIPQITPDGINDWMLGPNFADNLSSFTVFVVGKSQGNGAFLTKIANDTCQDPGSTGWSIQPGAVTVDQDTSNFSFQANGVAIGAFHVLTYEILNFTDPPNCYTDGVLSNNGSGFVSGVITSTATTEPVRLFIDGTFGTCDSFSVNPVRSVLIYAPAPNATDRAAIEAWLATNP